MSYLSSEEYELYRLARTLGGVSKAMELLKIMHKRNISVDDLLAYLKSIDYKVPSPLERKINDLERRILTLEGKPIPTRAPPVPPRLDKGVPKDERALKRRAKKGEITPQADYRLPILESLIEMGGSGRMQDVLDRVFTKVKDALKPKDFDRLESGTAIRWRNAAQWERWKLIKRGYLKKDSARGIWEITDEGRKLYERMK